MTAGWLHLFGWAVGICVALYAAHRAGLWMESRGWIYYRGAPRGSAAPALMELQKFVNPAIEHVIEAQQDEQTSDDAAGDPPVSGPSRSS